ncbi:hypothetical protein NM688_g7458 [Phlebia brevispora]|uniref:Uncharacterized protein n=1 Tax=Phlebia brevispora TaxID=194682 RepID=A0ACC1S4V7_9APHY|nr:hypothetical protein NM688_g7458 [Phlebia brevispora]
MPELVTPIILWIFFMDAQAPHLAGNLYIQAAVTAWLLYDYLLTLSDEVRCVWQRQYSATTFIFFIIRYSALLRQLRGIQYYWDGGGLDGARCTAISIIVSCTDTVFYTAVVAFAALRIYAITRKGTRKAALVFGLGLVFVFCDTYTASTEIKESKLYTSLGCQYTSNFGLLNDTFHTNQAINYAGIRRMLRHGGIGHPTLSLLIRDAIVKGTIIYSAVAMWGIISTVFSRDGLESVTIPYISTLACRFMFRLRQVRIAESNPASSSRDYISTRVVENIGGPLDLTSGYYDSLQAELHSGDGPVEVVTVTNEPLLAGLEHGVDTSYA